MRMPSVPPAASEPAAIGRSYLREMSWGSDTLPIDAAVATLEPLTAAPDLRFASGEVGELDAEIKDAAGGRDVWVVGGGDVASQYVAADLLDRVQLTVVPIVLGSGLPLFARPIERPLRLLGVEPFASGMAGLTYEVAR